MIISRLTELLNIDHPIIGAPMAGVAGSELASAISAAGGLGLIGGGYGEGNWLAEQLAVVDSKTIGVGFITWRLAKRIDLLAVALEHEPKAIFLSFGDMRPFAAKIRASSSLFIAQVQSLGDAQAAADYGADIIVAQGTEAGGHGGARATLPLVPAIVDAVDPIPVVAAGGIGDGRGLAAALMLGASGVVMGTRFYCAHESLAPAAAKARALAATGDNTTRSSVFDILREYDWPEPYNLRTVANELTDRYGADLAQLRRDKVQQVDKFKTSIREADYAIAAVIAGEALDLVKEISSADEIVGETIAEAEAQLRKPNNFRVSL